MNLSLVPLSVTTNHIRDKIKKMMDKGVALSDIVNTQFDLPYKQIEEMILELASQQKVEAPAPIKKATSKASKATCTPKEKTAEQQALEQEFVVLESEHLEAVEHMLDEAIAIRNNACCDAAKIEAYTAYVQLPFEQSVVEYICHSLGLARVACVTLVHNVIVKRIRAHESAKLVVDKNILSKIS